ncbi:MAG: DUF2784 family protein [Acidobacteria bacterium]|nr:DUF2784 family protein [Acidobacteriota bacterium]
MTWALLADAIVVVHLAFVAFVVLGGLMVWRWPRLAWVHVPAAAWGALVEFRGWVCPLTPLEVSWRLRAGQEGYTGDFVEQYLLPILYPEGLTRGVQIALGVFVVVVNVGVYAALLLRARRRSAPGAAGR